MKAIVTSNSVSSCKNCYFATIQTCGSPVGHLSHLRAQPKALRQRQVLRPWPLRRNAQCVNAEVEPIDVLVAVWCSTSQMQQQEQQRQQQQQQQQRQRRQKHPSFRQHAAANVGVCMSSSERCPTFTQDANPYAAAADS
jgi:hypothetical protein